MRKFAALIILGLMLPLIAFGQVPPVPPIPPAPPSIVNKPLTTVRPASNVHELTAADVETFLDGIVPLQLEHEDVAEETLFRPGSVSKLFTWTAVMQLVDRTGQT